MSEWTITIPVEAVLTLLPWALVWLIGMVPIWMLMEGQRGLARAFGWPYRLDAWDWAGIILWPLTLVLLVVVVFFRNVVYPVSHDTEESDD